MYIFFGDKFDWDAVLSNQRLGAIALPSSRCPIPTEGLRLSDERFQGAADFWPEGGDRLLPELHAKEKYESLKQIAQLKEENQQLKAQLG